MITEFSTHPIPSTSISHTYRAICTEVYDGDTYTMLVDLGFHTYANIRVRLLGVNTAELDSKDEVERTKAVVARDTTRQLLLNKPCLITTIKDTQSFNRWIATVSVVNENSMVDVAVLLLEKDLAEPFKK